VRAVTVTAVWDNRMNWSAPNRSLFLANAALLCCRDQVTVGATFQQFGERAQVNVKLDAQALTEIKRDTALKLKANNRHMSHGIWLFTRCRTRGHDSHASSGHSPMPATCAWHAARAGHSVLHYSAQKPSAHRHISTADSVTENIQLPTSVNYDDANLSIEVSLHSPPP